MNVHERVEVGNKKMIIPFPYLLSSELLVSGKENTSRKRKNKTREKKKKIRIEHKPNLMLLTLGIM